MYKFNVVGMINLGFIWARKKISVFTHFVTIGTFFKIASIAPIFVSYICKMEGGAGCIYAIILLHYVRMQFI